MIRILKTYLMMSFTVVNFLLTSQVRADEAPVQDMNFFLFLAESYVNENELITPLDLKEIEVSDVEKAQIETHNAEEEGRE